MFVENAAGGTVQLRQALAQVRLGARTLAARVDERRLALEDEENRRRACLELALFAGVLLISQPGRFVRGLEGGAGRPHRLHRVADIGGHRELIAHNVTGLLFSAGSPDAIAAAVSGWIADPARSARLLDEAYRYVTEDRTWANSVVRYRPVYERLAKKRLGR